MRSNLFGLLGTTEIHWLYMSVMVANSVLDGYLNTTLASSVIPILVEYVPLLADYTIADLFVWGSFWAVVIQLSLSVFNSWKALGTSTFLKEGVTGLMPILQWHIALYLTMQTEWGREHLALTTVLLCPAYCLINSKMIVCNFTNMETDMNAYEFLWFALFPLNAKLDLGMPEWSVAAVIFAVNFAIYATFVYCTIA